MSGWHGEYHAGVLIVRLSRFHGFVALAHVRSSITPNVNWHCREESNKILSMPRNE